MKANDPKTYRQMSEPLGDKAAAEARLEEFAKEVQALRIKYHIRNVVISTDTTYLDAENEECTTGGSVSLGNELEILLLARSVTDSMIEHVSKLFKSRVK